MDREAHELIVNNLKERIELLKSDKRRLRDENRRLKNLIVRAVGKLEGYRADIKRIRREYEDDWGAPGWYITEKIRRKAIQGRMNSALKILSKLR